MTFLENILARLERSATAPVLAEIHDGQIVSATGGELLSLIGQARGFLRARGLKPGDRCTLWAPNSIRWVALDLATMAEGLIAVPLDPRQVPKEIAAAIADCTPSLICCSDSALGTQIQASGGDPPAVALFDDIFVAENAIAGQPVHHADHDAVTIVYTSGTSGESKGVVLNAGNILFVVGRTNARLDQLMGARQEPDRVFQYAPFCFAAARILLFTSLSRHSVLALSTDLSKISEELKLAAPNYFVNVPLFLERVRRKVEESISKRGGFAATLFKRAQQAYLRRYRKQINFADGIWFAAANVIIFPAIRKNIGPNLEALICGSAPLSVETQLFFMMLGIPVLQVYGLTETTAICTMDDPLHFEPGRVGPAISGVEMTVSDCAEILVRGPNVFPGYWQRPAETAKALAGGWFHTGDQGEADAQGNWRITGRLKNLIVLASGHNVAPEPLEDAIAARVPEAQHVILVGNQRSSLAALVAGSGTNGNSVRKERVQSALDAINANLPHYKQIRAFQLIAEPFSTDNGLLTTNGKLKRDAIAARFASEIETLYRKKPA
jgi:long-chain acyl-CoA synthetase